MGSTVENVGVEGVTPILRVKDIQASIRWYREMLGFEREWGAEPPHEDFCSVARGRGSLMLCEGAQGCSGTWVWIGVDDIGPLYENCKARGATIHLPPTNYSWAYEMAVRDPDGHVLRLGCDPREDLPYQDLQGDGPKEPE